MIADLRRRTRWWGFGVYALVSLVHVASIAFGFEAIEYPTKLALMPTLAVAAAWSLISIRDMTAATLLFMALAFSLLGDGAAHFFPSGGSELPAMLACFGVAHLIYMLIFVRRVRVRRVPPWAIAYALWWGVMLAVLWPHLGALAIAVAVYGLVLGGTATLATRGGTVTAVGGAVFLLSDTLLAFRLFLPDVVTADATGPWIMLAYTLGQGLLAYGIARHVGRTDG
ncbi:lysoplasmalogenase family protein [Microbacterium dauci]|uniref:Lysoplasmalogenase family protein n=1 Tax=Microbacterium dauci TaxID=3048008 RepID=A0ABT6ZG10_9MICO|nr:lysoplasmalogenase family protein [Microbacterium sp. LX3-4]MDJ1115087.1 lysoplasmalogenase family protein [Microbacterium sp. LX3-4]